MPQIGDHCSLAHQSPSVCLPLWKILELVASLEGVMGVSEHGEEVQWLGHGSAPGKALWLHSHPTPTRCYCRHLA